MNLRILVFLVTLLFAAATPRAEPSGSNRDARCELHDCWDLSDPSLFETVQASKVLSDSIAHHDRQDVWSTRPIEITTEIRYGTRLAESRGYPSRRDRMQIDNASGRFRYESERAGDRVEVISEGDSFSARFNGSDEISAEDRETHRLTPEQLQTWRDYFLYVFGLPMKLRDPGTHLDPRVKQTEFNGREVLALRVTYTPEVGKDTWYFYFEPRTHALVGCRFFHDERANDGEHIVYEGEIEGPNGLRLPRLQHWYTNKDSELLATDEVLSVRSPSAR